MDENKNKFKTTNDYCPCQENISLLTSPIGLPGKRKLKVASFFYLKLFSYYFVLHMKV